MFGAWYAVRRSSTPEPSRSALNREENTASRSVIRKLLSQRTPVSQSVTLRAICSIQADVGFVVVPAM
jgi:hypothetical protein